MSIALIRIVLTFTVFARPEYIHTNTIPDPVKWETQLTVNSLLFRLWNLLFSRLVYRCFSIKCFPNAWFICSCRCQLVSQCCSLLLDKSGGQRWSPIMVYCQTPRRVDSQTCPLAGTSAIHPEVLQLFYLGDSCRSSAGGSRRRQPLEHTCLVQYHR